MTVLANAITASTSVIHVSAPLTVGSYQAPYTLDSEAVLITGGGGTSALSIERGQNGTARAAHVAGTTLTSGWGGGGTPQTVSLLGPTAIAFNTPDLNNPVNFGPAVLTIPAGSLFQVLALITEPWDVAGDLDLGVASDDQGTDYALVVAYFPQASSASNPTAGSLREANVENTAGVPSATALPRWALALTDQVICAGFFPSAGDPSAGSANVYALIATPS